MRSCFKCNTYERNNILLYLKCCKGGEKREFKNKGERERYTHLNAEFQRTVRRDKKAFLSDPCKETEENNRMGKTRDLFKKLEIPREHFMQIGHNKGQKWYGPNRSRRY